MTFDDVLEDIAKLIGMELDSIRPGATIKITDVDVVKDCLTLCNVRGQIKSRPISELETIWRELVRKPAVHVEGVLHGSGTSRNQPETIFANLPYIEWLKIDNKKHISYVGKQTHAFGKLREMDAVHAAEVVNALQITQASRSYTAIIVTSDIGKATQTMTASSPGTLSTVMQGAYRYESGESCVLFVSQSLVDIKEGTYCILETAEPASILPRIIICGTTYALVEQSNILALITMRKIQYHYLESHDLLKVAEDAQDDYKA